jgi:hypothetical protein
MNSFSRLSLRPVLLLGGLAALSFVSAFGCSVVNKVDEVTPPAGSADCASGQAFCGGACIDTSADSANCGNCGVACPDGVECNAGTCDLTCDTGMGPCGNECVDNLTDPSHCGQCSNACETAANQVATCDAGSCVIACADGFGDCNDDPTDGCEVDLLTTADHCGVCGAACLGPEQKMGACAAGVCSLEGECLQGYGDCDGDPVNGCEARFAGNLANCGACGTACTADQYCATTGGASSCVALKIFAADGRRFYNGLPPFKLWEIDVSTGAVTEVGDLSEFATGMGFYDGELLVQNTNGSVKRVDTITGQQTFFADVNAAGLGIAQVGESLFSCTPPPYGGQLRSVDPITGDATDLPSGFCSSRGTLVSDLTSLLFLRTTEIQTLDLVTGAEASTVALSANGPYRGATFHKGTLYAFRCGTGNCAGSGDGSGTTELVSINPADGTVTVVAAIPVANNLHALASPRAEP